MHPKLISRIFEIALNSDKFDDEEINEACSSLQELASQCINHLKEYKETANVEDQELDLLIVEWLHLKYIVERCGAYNPAFIRVCMNSVLALCNATLEKIRE